MIASSVWADRVANYVMSQCHADLRGRRRGERETCWRRRGVLLRLVSGTIGGIV